MYHNMDMCEDISMCKDLGMCEDTHVFLEGGIVKDLGYINKNITDINMNVLLFRNL